MRRRFDVTLLAIDEGKSNPVVTEAAIFTLRYLEHRILYRALLDAWKDIRVAHLSTVPVSVLLVRKDDVYHPAPTGADGEVPLRIHARTDHGNPTQHIGRAYEALLLGLFPVNQACLLLGQLPGK
jgi:hypothetical protein